ncbi:pyridoxamine 5'-phosphate oxidase family protein [Amycolatopsis sp. SID8362]|uniref:pyridoxamine 5'-phosphate oxidase family protein n=1 Tax=Amycolatopsis sp. SID8362 TaxID=2690346 RepID=UPI0013696457|nr:pyridoxamine 5'-phosphate oxidase family protein [Amycolatopsis sp. SID8362]NBH08638.1 pyridoxamine 5'-phosphate oxidase [Amycolatopsis sp. SID8362]NED45332.1 pyridoxamine 5'-phosphate oxidase [Amycolatopsis sp. SID8362]
MVVESSRVPPALADAFIRVAHRIVWCTLATVDRRGRPRSRVVHPIWQPDPLTGRLFTRPTPLKVAHLAATPWVSCSYWDPQHEVAVAECRAEFADDEASRKDLWNLFASAPEPLGYDPKILGGKDFRDPEITVLKLTPWRISTGGEAWRAA